MNSAVEVTGLTKRFGVNIALQEVTFRIPPGTAVGLVGDNGAGKSTAMRILAGCLAADSGSISFGPDVARRIRVGYAGETPLLYPQLTVEECLTFVARLKRCSLREVERVTEALGLAPHRRRLIGNLSQGFRQRAGFAQALIGDPELLILDEPTRGLDPTTRLDVLRVIRSLNRTVLLSTHILSEVADACEFIVVLHRGRLVYQGPTADFTAREPMDAALARVTGERA